ncbi:hypothetical protein [Dethiothermospora halolimnae]|uniref:hypothetical protein n=1 Tax=Dethiothermospora halolimnae TaxID=3114390 RepID=UPI003CCBD0F1
MFIYKDNKKDDLKEILNQIKEENLNKDYYINLEKQDKDYILTKKEVKFDEDKYNN